MIEPRYFGLSCSHLRSGQAGFDIELLAPLGSGHELGSSAVSQGFGGETDCMRLVTDLPADLVRLRVLRAHANRVHLELKGQQGCLLRMRSGPGEPGPLKVVRSGDGLLLVLLPPGVQVGAAAAELPVGELDEAGA